MTAEAVNRSMGALAPESRREALQRMSAEGVDLLVIGGGVTGTGIALDAASRGLRTGLVEARDLAAGTSSWSSKLVHGGLRYLEQRNFRLVREALRERALLLTRTAPHLVTTVPFLFPLRHRLWERPYIGAGIMLYDLLGGARSAPRHRHLTRRGALKIFPDLDPDAMIGGIQYHDGQVDDARLSVMLARTAAAHGALIATSAEVTGFAKDGDGRVTAAEVRDAETGGSLQIAAKAIVAATGVWTDPIVEMAGGERPFRVQMSKGIHFLVPRERITSETGMILRTEKSVLFLIPWGNRWIIGTTDTPWELDRERPTATAADIDYLLERINAVLRPPKLTRDDIVSVYAGLRPLVAARSGPTTRLSREHAIGEPAPNLFVIAGGKLTTYRVMAKDAVDQAAKRLGRGVPPSPTASVPLLGADEFAQAWERREDTARERGLPIDRVEHLLRRYGTAVDQLFGQIDEDPRLAEPIPGAAGYLLAEARHAASHEGALHLADVLERRTRISIETEDRGLVAAEPVAREMARVLGWDDGRVRDEVARYRGHVEGMLEAERQATDEAADAVQAGAPDPRIPEPARSSPSAGAAEAAATRSR